MRRILAVALPAALLLGCQSKSPQEPQDSGAVSRTGAASAEALPGRWDEKARQRLLAVGDSWADADMLDYASYALLIDRGYADLRKKAEEAGWIIQPALAQEE